MNSVTQIERHPVPATSTGDESHIERERRASLGQFLTPPAIADLMASFFQHVWDDVRLLDPGAGEGSLTAAYIKRVCGARRKPKKICVTAFEVDEKVLPGLRRTLAECQRMCEEAGVQFYAVIQNGDFIEFAVAAVREDLFSLSKAHFNVAIANPPYRKIHSDSEHRKLLGSVGIETSNLYAGFVALMHRLLEPGGEAVSITPRSFCNGPYFKPFRAELLGSMALERLHLFESRSAAFKGDDVLQENVIVHAIKGKRQPAEVIISTSRGGPGDPIKERTALASDVVSPHDPEQFIHLFTDGGTNGYREKIARLPAELSDLGLSVSTGRVVDFRAKRFLSNDVTPGAVPLIYPCHFSGAFVEWPKENSRKPNALKSKAGTEDLLVPRGCYVLVKRFTSKEERRRVVACILDAKRIGAAEVGIENHLNYFHANGKGLPERIAKGLFVFLNSTVVDQYFRQFSGHTQVNATDLRSLRYPSARDLERIGVELGAAPGSQEELDEMVNRVIA